MVTVIEDKKDLPASAHNGVSNHDNEQYQNIIRDFKQVDFHSFASCKPFPRNLTQLVESSQSISSIEGIYYVQVDKIEPVHQANNTQNSNNRFSQNQPLVLTITDGVTTVKSVAQPDIKDMCTHVKRGRKLFIRGSVKIQDKYLQLTAENTSFEFGSNKFSRPLSSNHFQNMAPTRNLFDRRRGNGNHVQTRHGIDHEDSGTFKQPPTKNTLLDFMSQNIIENLKVSSGPGDSDQCENDQTPENKPKSDDRFKNRTDSLAKTSKENVIMDSNQLHMSRSNSKNDFHHHQISSNDQVDHEDRLSHSSHRERRSQLPPRLQRAHEERSRRSINRNYDETYAYGDSENHSDYDKIPYSHSAISSSTDYFQYQNPVFIQNSSTTSVPHANEHHSYAMYSSMIPTMTTSGQAAYTYIPSPMGPVTYAMNDVSANSFPMQQGAIYPPYQHDGYGIWYPAPQQNISYLQMSMSHHGTFDQTNHIPENNDQNHFENIGTLNNEFQTGETNDNENHSQTSSIESKVVMHPSSPSMTDGKASVKKLTNQQPDQKSRNSTVNSRPNWKINDTCLARWHADQEFYVATITKIHESTCTVQYRDYYDSEEVHFKDLKALTQDSTCHQGSTMMAVPSSDMNTISGACFQPYQNYYAQSCDGYLTMPEAPPFPFNPTGTVYINQQNQQGVVRSNRVPPSPQSSRRQNENNSNNSNSDSPIKNEGSSAQNIDRGDAANEDGSSSSNDNIEHDDQSIEPNSSNTKTQVDVAAEVQRKSETNAQAGNQQDKSKQA